MRPSEQEQVIKSNALTQQIFRQSVKFILNQQNGEKRTIKENNFPPSRAVVMIDNIFDHSINKDTNKPYGQRTIRYIPGEKSIFLDEQTAGLTPKPGELPVQKEYIHFIKGEKIVHKSDDKYLEWMMRTDFNGSNPKRDPKKPILFWVFDMGAGMEQMKEKHKMLAQATSWAYDGAWSEVKAYARVLNLPVDTTEPDEIRYSMAMKIETAHKEGGLSDFMKNINSPVIARTDQTLWAIQRGIVTVSVKQNSLAWSDGGVFHIAPIGKNVVDDFVSLTFTQNTYKGAMKEIQNRLEPLVQEEQQAEELKKQELTVKVDKLSHLNDDQIWDIVRNAIQEGKMERLGAYTVYNNKNYKGKAPLIAAMRNNPEEFPDIIDVVEK